MAKGKLEELQERMGWTYAELQSFIEELKEAMEAPKYRMAASTEDAVTQFLWDIGCSSKIFGYQCIRAALLLLIDDEEKYKQKVVRELYPAIAKEVGATPKCVERTIRYAVEKMANTPNDILEKIFANSNSYFKGKPSNAEFLYGCLEYIKHNI